jgi:AcrR family transcriptional regulator
MVFYTYFEDREEIMHSLINRQQAKIQEHFKDLLEKARTEPVIDVLRVVLNNYAETAHDHPKIYRLFWMTPIEEGEGEERIRSYRHLDPSLNNIAQLLEQGMSKGEFVDRDPNLAAAVVMAIMNAPLMLHRCGRKPADYSCEQILSETLTAVFAYLTTDKI